MKFSQRFLNIILAHAARKNGFFYFYSGLLIILVVVVSMLTARATPGQNSLSASWAVTPVNVNLSAEGTADWGHWGLSTPTTFNHKNGVTQQISNYTVLGTAPIFQFKNTNSYTWTGGTPTASATNTATGVYVIGLNNGFKITVPANTTTRTLKMYVGLWAACGRFEASLSDGSAPVYVDTSLSNSSATSNVVYTLNYRATSAGQTLTIKWTVNTVFNQWGNITLQAATLVANTSATPTATDTFTPTPTNTPTVSPTNIPTVITTATPINTPTNAPTNTATLTATTTATMTATSTLTRTATNTPSATTTKTPTNAPSNTPTATVTITSTPTATPTRTSTSTPTNTPTVVPSNTPFATPTGTPATLFTCDYYAAPNGSPTGSGTNSSPWSLQAGLNKTSVVVAGKTLCLQGGVYRGKFKSTLNGGTVRGLAGAVIDGYLFTTLAGSMDATQNTITVADASMFVTPQQLGGATSLIVDGEALYINSISGNTINVNRAAAGSSTVSVAHTAGAIVRMAGNQLYTSGNNTTYQDIEIRNSDPLRNWNTDGAEGLRGCGVFNTGNGNKFVNLNIHDNLNGIFSGSSSSNTEVYGTLSYNNGQFDDTTDGKGHGMYLENASGYSRIHDNIVLNNFGNGTQLYGRTAAYPGGDIQGNVWANSGAPLGAGVRHHNLVVGPETQRIADILIQNNFFFHPHSINAYNMVFGYGAGVDNGRILNNYFVGGGGIGLELTDVTNVTATGNKFYTSNSSGINIQSSQAAYTVNNNMYYGTASNADEFGNVTAHANQTFALWKSTTGFDSTSTISSNALPDTVIIRPNAYQQGRANVVVYAPSAAASITVNLSQSGLTNGQAYTIQNAFNFNGPAVISGTYNSASPTISIPLGGASSLVAIPFGSSYTPPTTSPQLAVFVVVPTTSSTSTPTATPTNTTTRTPTATPTNTPTQTSTPAVTNTPTRTPTAAATSTPTNTPTRTSTATPTSTPAGSNISLDPSTLYQTMRGWEAVAEAGQFYSPAWNSYKNPLLDQAVNDLGINRVRLEITSGIENPIDYFTQWQAGQITEDQYNAKRYEIINDNSNSSVINPSGFPWSSLDATINQVVLPMRQRLQGRGELLWVNVNYVDFGSSSFEHKNSSAEYAEFVLATYQHMQSAFGFVPDSWEVILEPDTSSASWSSSQTANAIKSAGDRLASNGFTPNFTAPSTTNAANAPAYIDRIAATSGAMQYVSEFSYHRYAGASSSTLAEIANRAALYNKKTGMLEWIGADYSTLHEDLRLGLNSSWQQFCLAGPTSWGPEGNGDRYYVIDDTNVSSPVIIIGSKTKFLRQYFKFIRAGAQRIEAVTGDGNFDPLAFVNMNGKYVVVVKAGGSGAFNIQGLPTGLYGIKYTTDSQYNIDRADVSISTGQTLSATIPAAGVITVYEK